MADDKVKKIKIQYEINVGDVKKQTDEVVRAIEKGGRDIESAASKTAGSAARVLGRAGIFIDPLFRGQRQPNPLAGYQNSGLMALDSYTGVGALRFANREAKKRIKEAQQEIRDNDKEIERIGKANFDLQFKRTKQKQKDQTAIDKEEERTGKANFDLKRKRAKARLDEERRSKEESEKEEERIGKANFDLKRKRVKQKQKEESDIEKEEERIGKANFDLRQKRTKAKLKNDAKLKKDAEDEAERTGKANFKLRTKRTKEAIKTRNKADKQTENVARANYKLRFKRAKQRALDQKRINKTNEKNRIRKENEEKRRVARRQRQRQMMAQRFMGSSRAAASFAGAAVGSSLFALGSHIPGGFGSIPGLMASRAFGGMGLGASLGSVLGPAGMIAGGGLGMVAGGAIGLFEGGIPAAVDALVKGASFAVGIMYEGGSRLMQAGAEYQRQVTKFGIMTGDKSYGQLLYSGIENLATITPYSMNRLGTSAEMLLGYGVSKGNVVPAVSRLSEIAGGDSTRLERLTLAFGQVMAQGKLAGQELRQFTEAGIGIEDFARTAGMSTFQFRSKMEQGQISSGVMVDTINRLTSPGGRFYGMNKEIGGTEYGSFNILMGTIEKYERRVGDFLNKKLNTTGIIQSLTEWVEPAAAQVEKFVDTVVTLGKKAASSLSEPLMYMKELVSQINGRIDLTSVAEGTGAFAKNAVTKSTRFAAALTDLAVRPMSLTNPLSEHSGISLRRYEYSNANGEWNGAPNFSWHRKLVDDENRTLRPAQFALQQSEIRADEMMWRKTHGVDVYGSLYQSTYKEATGVYGQLQTQDFNAPKSGLRNIGVGNKYQTFGTGMSGSLKEAMKNPKIESGDATYPEAAKIAEQLRSTMSHKGLDAYDEFGNTMRNLNTARYTPPGLNSGSLITDEEFRYGRYKAFQQLKKEMHDDRNQVRFANSIEYGSEHGTGAIFGSLEAQSKIETPFMEIMNEALLKHKETVEELKKLNDFFDNNKDNMKLFIEVTDGGP